MEKLGASVSVVQEYWEVFASLVVVQPTAVHLICAMDLHVDFARDHWAFETPVQVAMIHAHMVATIWVLPEHVHKEVAWEVEVAHLGMLSQSPRAAPPQVSQKSYNSFLRHSHLLVRLPLEAGSLLFLVQFQQTMLIKMVLPIATLDKPNCFL